MLRQGRGQREMSLLPVVPRGGGISTCFQEWAGCGDGGKHQARETAETKVWRWEPGGECSGLATRVLSVLPVLGDHVQPGHVPLLLCTAGQQRRPTCLPGCSRGTTWPSRRACRWWQPLLGGLGLCVPIGRHVSPFPGCPSTCHSLARPLRPVLQGLEQLEDGPEDKKAKLHSIQQDLWACSMSSLFTLHKLPASPPVPCKYCLGAWGFPNCSTQVQ